MVCRQASCSQYSRSNAPKAEECTAGGEVGFVGAGNLGNGCVRGGVRRIDGKVGESEPSGDSQLH